MVLDLDTLIFAKKIKHNPKKIMIKSINYIYVKSENGDEYEIIEKLYLSMFFKTFKKNDINYIYLQKRTLCMILKSIDKKYFNVFFRENILENKKKKLKLISKKNEVT